MGRRPPREQQIETDGATRVVTLSNPERRGAA